MESYKDGPFISIDNEPLALSKTHIDHNLSSKKLHEIEYNKDEILEYIDESIVFNDEEHTLSDRIDLENMIAFLEYFVEYFSKNYSLLPKDFLKQSNIYILLSCLFTYPSFDLHHTLFEVLSQLSDYVVPENPGLIGEIFEKMYDLLYQIYDDENEIHQVILNSQMTEIYESSDALKERIVQDFFNTVSNWMIDLPEIPSFFNEGQLMFLQNITLSLENDACELALKFFQIFLFYAKKDEDIQTKMDGDCVGQLVVFCMNNLQVYKPKLCLYIAGLLAQISGFDEFVIYLIENGIESKILDVLGRHHIEISEAMYRLAFAIIKYRNIKEQDCRFASSNRFYEIMREDLSKYEGEIIVQICKILCKCMEFWELIYEYNLQVLLELLHEGPYKSQTSALMVILLMLENVPFETRVEMLNEKTFDSIANAYDDEKPNTAERTSEVMLKVLKYEDFDNTIGEIALETEFPESLESFVESYNGEIEMPFSTELLDYLHEINGD